MANLKVVHAGNSCVMDGKKYHDDTAIQNLVDYCLDSSKMKSGCAGALAVDLYNAAEQMIGLTAAYGKNFGIRCRHFILSFEPEERMTPSNLRQIAYRVAMWYGCQYQIIWGIHENTDNLHVHFLMNTTSYVTGKKYRGEKSDYYGFKKYVSEVLADYSCKLIDIS